LEHPKISTGRAKRLTGTPVDHFVAEPDDGRTAGDVDVTIVFAKVSDRSAVPKIVEAGDRLAASSNRS
jgi:hypothetical protein